MAGETVLVCVAHPDDEVLGCGGTIARHTANGDVVHLLFVCDGVTARQGATGDAHAVGNRREASARAAKILGAQPPEFLNYPDQELDAIPRLKVTQSVESVARRIKPSIVYTHFSNDLNSDHRRISEVAMTAFRPYPGQSVCAVYSFEIPSSTEWGFLSREPFQPSRFVDISATLARKIEALRAYDAEMRAFPHARSYKSVEALALWRGASVGLHAAEAFSVLREVVP